MHTEFHRSSQMPSKPSALTAWQSLVSGRYAITQRYDRAGKRYLVAAPKEGRPLTPRQRDVLACRARGATLKVIAFDLGVSIGTVSHDLSLAMERLGLESVADLVAVFGHEGA